MKFHKSKKEPSFAAKRARMTLSLCLFLILLLTGCGRIAGITGAIEKEDAHSTVQNEIIEEQSLVGYPQRLDVDTQTAEELLRKCEEIALLCHDLMVNGESEAQQYFPYDTILTQTAIDEVEMLLFKSGYPVINSDAVYPPYLENSSGLKRFYELADNGETAEQSVVYVSVYNAIYYTTFQYADEKVYDTNTVITWDKSGKYQISEPVKTELLD